MSIRRWLGVDAVDLVLQVALTFCVGGFVVGMADSSVHDPIVFGITGASFGILAYRRNRALRRRETHPEFTGETSAARLEEIDQRLADLEAREIRVAELEERLEFAERLLTRPTAPDQRALQ